MVIMGGPSILGNQYDLSQLSKKNVVTFLEAKALTPEFLKFGYEPHFHMLFFPEKAKSNGLQWSVVQGLSVDYDILPLLNEKAQPEATDFKNHLSQYLEMHASEMPHKRFRWKPDVFPKKSPFDLLPKFKKMALLMTAEGQKTYCPHQSFENPVHTFDIDPQPQPHWDLEKYFTTPIKNGRLTLNNFGHVNSAAIALFPLLKFMGFKKITFLGMDLSMMGSMEYAANYTFNSMKHFGKFYESCRNAFSADYPRGALRGAGAFVYHHFLKNKGRTLLQPEPWKRLFHDAWDDAGNFMRSKDQLRALSRILAAPDLEFTNVYEPQFKYSRGVPGIRNLNYREFLRL